MESDSLSAWGVSRPHVRLWLTLALGILGMFLLRAEDDFAPHAFANVRGATLFAWLIAAFASVLLLHRMENRRMPITLYLLMGLALALSLMVPPGVGRIQHQEGRGLAGFAWFCFIFLFLIVGASAARPRFQGGASPCSWRESLLCGPIIALTAPLLLFASRPVDGNGSSSTMQRLSRSAFAVFPHALAAGFALPFALSEFGYRKLSSGLGLPWLSFTVWAWLGCALLFVLSPWPAYPRILKRAPLTKARKMGSLATVAFVAIALLQLAILREGVFFMMFFHPILIGGGVGCVLAVVLIPWPEYPSIPRLGELSQARKTSPLTTAIFLAIALVALGSFALGPFLHVASGQLFAGEFNRIHTGGALDQPSLHKWFNLFTFFSASVFAYVATARWMSDRRTRLGYWAFAVPTVALCLCLLSILTLPFYWLIQYIGAMGCTVRRIHGLAYGLTGYIIVLVFLCWAIWPFRKEKKV